jgi:hypothetical protein
MDYDDSIPNHSQRNCFFYFFYKIVSHGLFSFIIVLIIIANTLLLAMDSDYLTAEQRENLDLSNKVFTWVFIVELIIKLLGLGFKEYFRDTYN